MARPAFEVVHDPPDAEVDIIAVHGLGANADWTWTWKDPKVRSNEVRWLSDSNMLPAIVPKARVVVYNYDSKWHADAPRVTLQICGNRFIQTLHDFRRSLPERPIVFIGHSLGSIVIQQGLLIADMREDLRYLTHVTSGLVTLGSPLRGIRKNVQPSFLVKLLQFRGAWGGIIDELTYENDALLEKLERFIMLAKARAFDVFCFFELYETKFGKKFFLGGKFGVPLRAMIVPETSACLSGFDRCGLQADHFRINKFSGPNDASFMRVSAQLQQMCTIISSHTLESPSSGHNTEKRPVAASLAEAESPAEIDQCLKHIFVSNARDDLSSTKRMKGERAEGTCEWIMETSELQTWLTSADSQTWMSAPPNFLWLKGNPGVGKSTMAIFLTEHFLDTTSLDKGSSVAFFLCSSTFGTRNDTTAILRGLLWQILSKHRNLVSRYVLPAYKVQGASLFVSFDALWSLFLAVMSDQNSGTKYLIVDGLDECKEDARFALLKQLKKAFGSKGSLRASYHCRLLLLSRPSPDIQRTLRGLKFMDLSKSPQIAKDVSKFIEEKVSDLRDSIPYPPTVAEDVSRLLKHKAGGTFLWAGIACAELERCDAKDAVRCLEILPPTLNDMYKGILDTACGHSVEKRDKTRRILSFAIAATYPLSLLELSAACNLHTEHSSETRGAFMLEEIEACRRLLIVDDGQVYILHESVKDFLFDKASGAFIDEKQAHANLAYRCIEMIFWSSIEIEASHSRRLLWSGVFGWSRFDHWYGRFRRIEGSTILHPEKDVFLGYAIFRWPTHVRLACRKFEVSGLTALFFNARTTVWRAWSELYFSHIMCSSPDTGHSEGQESRSWLNWTALDVAALTDTPTLANFALHKQEVSVEGRHLMYAAVENHWEMFDALVANIRMPAAVSAASVESFIAFHGAHPRSLEVLRTLFRHEKVESPVTPSLLLCAAQKRMPLFHLLLELRSDGMTFSSSDVREWMRRWWKNEDHAMASRILLGNTVTGFIDSDCFMEHLVSMEVDRWPAKDILGMSKIVCDFRCESSPITHAIWVKAAANSALGPELVRMLPQRDFPILSSNQQQLVSVAACNIARGVDVLQALFERAPNVFPAAITEETLSATLKTSGTEHLHQLLKLSLFEKSKIHEEDMLICAASNSNRDLSSLFSDATIPPGSITERVLVAAANNGKHGPALFEVLLAMHRGLTPFSEAVVFQAAQTDTDLFDLLLNRGAFDKSLITHALYARAELGEYHTRSGNFSRNLIRRRDPELPIPDIVAVARHLTTKDVREMLDWQGHDAITKKAVLAAIVDTESMYVKEDIIPLIYTAKPDLVMIDTEALDLALSLFPTFGMIGPQRVIDRVREVRGGQLLKEEEEAIVLWRSSRPVVDEHVIRNDLRNQFLEIRRKYASQEDCSNKWKEWPSSNCEPGSTAWANARRDKRSSFCLASSRTEYARDLGVRKRKMSV